MAEFQTLVEVRRGQATPRSLSAKGRRQREDMADSIADELLALQILARDSMAEDLASARPHLAPAIMDACMVLFSNAVEVGGLCTRVPARVEPRVHVHASGRSAWRGLQPVAVGQCITLPNLARRGLCASHAQHACRGDPRGVGLRGGAPCRPSRPLQSTPGQFLESASVGHCPCCVYNVHTCTWGQALEYVGTPEEAGRGFKPAYDEFWSKKHK